MTLPEVGKTYLTGFGTADVTAVRPATSVGGPYITFTMTVIAPTWAELIELGQQALTRSTLSYPPVAPPAPDGKL